MMTLFLKLFLKISLFIRESDVLNAPILLKPNPPCFDL